MNPRPLYRELASILQAIENCHRAGNHEWLEKHETRLAELERLLPSGSGIDCGTKIDRDRSSTKRLVLHCSFHHMNEHGFYDGWTEHTVTVNPSFDGIDLRISGRDRNEIKDYLHEAYHSALTELV